MAFVQATVHFARVVIAVFAEILSPPVGTSIALTAGVFEVAVLAPVALRAPAFAAAVLAPVALRAMVLAAAVLAPVALRAMVLAAAVLTLQTLLCRPGRRSFTHSAPRMHVARILALAD